MSQIPSLLINPVWRNVVMSLETDVLKIETKVWYLSYRTNRICGETWYECIQQKRFWRRYNHFVRICITDLLFCPPLQSIVILLTYLMWKIVFLSLSRKSILLFRKCNFRCGHGCSVYSHIRLVLAGSWTFTFHARNSPEFQTKFRTKKIKWMQELTVIGHKPHTTAVHRISGERILYRMTGRECAKCTHNVITNKTSTADYTYEI